jgi:hypothetical protein
MLPPRGDEGGGKAGSGEEAGQGPLHWLSVAWLLIFPPVGGSTGGPPAQKDKYVNPLPPTHIHAEARLTVEPSVVWSWLGWVCRRRAGPHVSHGEYTEHEWSIEELNRRLDAGLDLQYLSRSQGLARSEAAA